MPFDSTHGPASRTLPDLLVEQAHRHGDRPAILSPLGTRTWRELEDGAARVRTALRAAGLGPGDTVGLLVANRPEWVEAAFGILGTGARLAAFNTWAKAWDLAYLVGHAEVTLLIAAPSAGSNDLLEQLDDLLPEARDRPPGAWRSERFPSLEGLVVLPGGSPPQGARAWDDFLSGGRARTVDVTGTPSGADPGVHPIDPSETAFILYTSGSTAHPKAVPLVHGSLIENGFNIGERMGLTAEDRVWLASPLFWSFGCANALMATFTHGATLVLQPGFEPAQAAELLVEHRVTAGYLMPPIAEALLREHRDAIVAAGTLRTGLMIGRPDELRRVALDLGVSEICNIYGATETYGNCCVTPHDLPLETRIHTQGPPLPGVQLRLVDGEAQVRGHITPGYLGDPEATAKVMTDDGWYRTGDVGAVDDDGNFTFTGRRSEMIKTSGINVSPAEIERFLVTHAEVAEVVVVGAPHPTKDQAPVAFVLPAAGAAPEAGALRAFCRDGIAGYMVPAAIVVVDGFPQTTTGKIARRLLVDRAAEAIAATSPAPSA